VQPGEEHKRERLNVCKEAKRRWNRRRAHEAGAGKGGLSVDRSLLFQRLGGEKPHQRDSTEHHFLARSTNGAPRFKQSQQNQPSGRIPGKRAHRRHNGNTSLSLIPKQSSGQLSL
jgi:hypothetical protein